MLNLPEKFNNFKSKGAIFKLINLSLRVLYLLKILKISNNSKSKDAISNTNYNRWLVILDTITIE